MGPAITSSVAEISSESAEGSNVHEKNENVEEHVLYGAGKLNHLIALFVDFDLK